MSAEPELFVDWPAPSLEAGDRRVRQPSPQPAAATAPTNARPMLERDVADDPAFQDAWHRLDPDPARIDCRDYRAHRSQHRWIDGAGWRCDMCDPDGS